MAETTNGEKPEPLGMCCPRCGCPELYTTRTQRLPRNRVRRYKTCAHCGRRLVTFEVAPSDLPRR